jgi:hypothetical protein
MRPRRRPWVIGLTILAGFALGACSTSQSPQASPTTTTTSAALIPAPVPANQSAQDDAQLACNFYSHFLALFPTYLQNPGQAVRAVEAWFNEAAAADRGNVAYHPLATDISTFLTEVGDSATWAQNGTPTDTRSRRSRRSAGHCSPRVSCADSYGGAMARHRPISPVGGTCESYAPSVIGRTQVAL